MHKDFSLVTMLGLELLVYGPWWEAGLLHGMTTRVPGEDGQTLVDQARRIARSVQVDTVALPLQCHGNDAVDLRGVSDTRALVERYGDLIQREQGDAIVAPAKQILSETTIAYGIVTADCLPILVRADDGFALIHAGWRGLANGVIAKGVSALKSPKQAVIFAAAGASQYEVGPEVIEAIGATCVYSSVGARRGFQMLDTTATAIKQLHQLSLEIGVVASGVCTISDPRFHSFRRDGSRAGRCCTFVVPEAQV